MGFMISLFVTLANEKTEHIFLTWTILDFKLIK